MLRLTSWLMNDGQKPMKIKGRGAVRPRVVSASVLLSVLFLSSSVVAGETPLTMFGLVENIQLGEYTHRVIPLVCFEEIKEKKKTVARWSQGADCAGKIEPGSVIALTNNGLEPIGKMPVEKIAESEISEDIGTMQLMGNARGSGKFAFATHTPFDKALAPFAFKPLKRSEKEYKEHIQTYFSQEGLPASFSDQIYVSKVQQVELNGGGKEELLIFAASMPSEVDGDVKAVGILLLITWNPNDDSPMYVALDLQKVEDPEALAEYTPLLYPDIDGDSLPEIVVNYRAASFGGTAVYKLSFKEKKKRKKIDFDVTAERVGQYHWGH